MLRSPNPVHRLFAGATASTEGGKAETEEDAYSRPATGCSAYQWVQPMFVSGEDSVAEAF